MKLNNKGFTLIEILAVVVILSVLMAIMIPSVGTILEKNRQSNYEDLKSSIVQAAKMYMSDNRYEVSIERTCNSSSDIVNVTSVNGVSLMDEENTSGESRLAIKELVDVGNIKTNKEGNIVDPRDNTKILSLEDSFIYIQYQCKNKDYVYELVDEDLQWK